MDYETIKALAKERRLSVDDLLAMARKNDPFYFGTPADWEAARWFKGVWDRFGYHTAGFPVHLRRIHYRLVSQERPIELWFDHKPYINTETCWENLGTAVKAARYLGLVPFDGFIDARNPETEVYVPEQGDGPRVEIEALDGVLYGLPFLPLRDLPALPRLALRGYEGRQRYHIWIFAEKTTMHDILRPLCRQYQVNLLAASGQLSIPQVYRAACRIRDDGRPARILYLSDLDPAGDSMPVAGARKLEWFQHFTQSPLREELADIDVRLEKVAITRQQGDDYNLPRTPLKESVSSRNKDWANRHGEGGLELDALEALHPGALRRIMTRALSKYFDGGLEGRVYSARKDVERALGERGQRAVVDLQGRIEAVKSQYDALRKEIAPRLQALDTAAQETWDAVTAALREESREIDLDDWPIPEAAEAEEDDEPLFKSDRTYDEQLAAYKAFQGRGNGNCEEVA
jgi:hypothetical protein